MCVDRVPKGALGPAFVRWWLDRGPPSKERGECRRADHILIYEESDPLCDVCKLANVPRPAVGEEKAPGVWRQPLWWRRIVAAGSVQEAFGEQDDVVPLGL